MITSRQEKYIYAIDIGGTNLRVALISLIQGRVIDFAYQRYPQQTSIAVILDSLIAWLDKLAIRCSVPRVDVLGLGMSFPGLIDKVVGKVANWPNRQEWNGFELHRYLTEQTGLLVVIEEDANAIALAEYVYGQHGTEHLLSVVVGTGIGCGVIAGGNLYRGMGWSGELGHIRLIPENGPPCTCGQTGCLQALASGSALLSRAREKAHSTGAVVHLATAEDVADMAYKGHEWARETFVEAAKWLALGIASAVRLYDVDVIVLGGGVLESEDLIVQEFREEFDRQLTGWPRRNEIRVEVSCLGAQAGIFGAAAVIAHQFQRGEQS